MINEDIFAKGIGNKERVIYNCLDCGKELAQKKSIRCHSCSKIAKLNPAWKGDKVKYRALHSWVRRNKPIPLNCEECKNIKILVIANISGEYKRNINDYKWLCKSCHNKLDNIGLNFHKLIKPNKRRLKNE